MKICILESSYQQSDSPMKDYDPVSDVIRHLEGHECETVYLDKATAVRSVVELASKSFDVFMNLCDGAWDEDRAGIEVVQTLERLGLPFTGATSKFYEPTREMMKRVCHFWGIKAPAYVFATDSQCIKLAEEFLKFPLIVKHPSSYSSIGLTRESRVETAADLDVQAKRMISEFGATLIEEFIEGREFSVLVVENAAEELQPFAYHPVEFRFPNGESFKHFDLKWKNYETMTHLQCDDDDLAERLKDISRKLFVGLNGSGYGRCDIRMNDRGELFMLEINPNCDIAYPLEEAGSADLILLHEPWGHREFFEKIIEAALSRHRRQRKKWKVLFSTKGRYATHAVETIKAGEMIHSYEEHTHVLVSQTHVRQNWNATQQQRFSEHAYPLSDEIFVSWSHEPEQWEPINHSCDPNTWLEGLNVVARRMISAGEEVTIDYATFHDERMPAFACKCHASECRGMIRGTDFTEPFMERYGDHVSDYIRRRRALAARR